MDGETILEACVDYERIHASVHVDFPQLIRAIDAAIAQAVAQAVAAEREAIADWLLIYANTKWSLHELAEAIRARTTPVCVSDHGHHAG